MAGIKKTKVVLLIIIPLTLLFLLYSTYLNTGFFTRHDDYKCPNYNYKNTGGHWFSKFLRSDNNYACPNCNVILISIDTLRADHLGSYGYFRNTSPNIDRFASGNVLFENAIVQASWTVPSHMSIMTSLYPSVHKLQRYPKAGRLDDSVVTLAQVLKANGYRTVSFNGGGYIGKEFGFNRGFDIYNSRLNTYNTSAAFNWLYTNHDKKFFLFFHTYGPHRPYSPPSPYIYTFFPDYNVTTDGKYTLRGGYRKKYWDNQPIEGEDLQRVIALYDGEISHIDHEIDRLLDALDYLNLSDDTIIIFTSDHGDEFFEHGGHDHTWTSYQELIHVPLIIKFPGIENRRIENRVQSIDIMPTVLDFLDIAIPRKLQGTTLLPLIREENINLCAYSEGGSRGQVKAIINNEWKYIYNVENRKEKLYNLENDPSEQNNMIDERPEIAQNLREELSRWMEENERLAESYSSSAAELENETKEALKALGYIT